MSELGEEYGPGNNLILQLDALYTSEAENLREYLLKFTNRREYHTTIEVRFYGEPESKVGSQYVYNTLNIGPRPTRMSKKVFAERIKSLINSPSVEIVRQPDTSLMLFKKPPTKEEFQAQIPAQARARERAEMVKAVEKDKEKALETTIAKDDRIIPYIREVQSKLEPKYHSLFQQAVMKIVKGMPNYVVAKGEDMIDVETIFGTIMSKAEYVRTEYGQEDEIRWSYDDNDLTVDDVIDFIWFSTFADYPIGLGEEALQEAQNYAFNNLAGHATAGWESFNTAARMGNTAGNANSDVFEAIYSVPSIFSVTYNLTERGGRNLEDLSDAIKDDIKRELGFDEDDEDEEGEEGEDEERDEDLEEELQNRLDEWEYYGDYWSGEGVEWEVGLQLKYRAPPRDASDRKEEEDEEGAGYAGGAYYCGAKDKRFPSGRYDRKGTANECFRKGIGVGYAAANYLSNAKLERMTIRQLAQVAKEYAVGRYGSLRRNELIDAIKGKRDEGVQRNVQDLRGGEITVDYNAGVDGRMYSDIYDIKHLLWNSGTVSRAPDLFISSVFSAIKTPDARRDVSHARATAYKRRDAETVLEDFYKTKLDVMYELLKELYPDEIKDDATAHARLVAAISKREEDKLLGIETVDPTLADFLGGKMKAVAPFGNDNAKATRMGRIADVIEAILASGRTTNRISYGLAARLIQQDVTKDVAARAALQPSIDRLEGPTLSWLAGHFKNSVIVPAVKAAQSTQHVAYRPAVNALRGAIDSGNKDAVKAMIGKPFLEYTGGIIDEATFKARQARGLYTGSTYADFSQRALAEERRGQNAAAALADRNRQYAEYVRQNPSQQDVRCRVGADLEPSAGDVIPQYLCEQRHAQRREKLNDANPFGKVLKGLTTVGDVLTSVVPMPGAVKAGWEFAKGMSGQRSYLDGSGQHRSLAATKKDMLMRHANQKQAGDEMRMYYGGNRL